MGCSCPLNGPSRRSMVLAWPSWDNDLPQTSIPPYCIPVFKFRIIADREGGIWVRPVQEWAGFF